jgi:hypothetical protein
VGALHGGMSKAGEVWRLFNLAAKAGRKLYDCNPGGAAAALFCIATYDAATGGKFVYIANAADRTLALTGLPPERLEVEPYFGSLAALPGFTPYFAPRPVVASGDFPREGLVVRPRTVAVWRVPADSRRVRTVVAPAAGRMAAGKTLVTISIDDSEAFRQEIDAGVFSLDGVGEGLPIELDLAGARRLTVTVDYGTGGDLGSPVRFTTPVIEK